MSDEALESPAGVRDSHLSKMRERWGIISCDRASKYRDEKGGPARPDSFCRDGSQAWGTKVTQSKPGLNDRICRFRIFAIPIRSAWEAETNRINHLGEGLVWQRTCNLECDCLPRNKEESHGMDAAPVSKG
jgi:hypothetical protein